MSTPEQIGTEVAKGVGDAVKEVITNLVGPPTKELGLLAGDVIANWRAANLVRLYQRFRTKADTSFLSPEAMERLPFGFRALIVEEGSREEDPEIQTIWANLLASALEEGYSPSLKSYAQDLKYFTPLMARITVAINNQGGEQSPNENLSEDKFEVMKSLAHVSDGDVDEALATLQKLGFLSLFPDKLHPYEIDGLNRLNDEFGDDVGALANQVRMLMLDVVERTPLANQPSYKRYSAEGCNGVWFEMILTPYGCGFCNHIGLM